MIDICASTVSMKPIHPIFQSGYEWTEFVLVGQYLLPRFLRRDPLNVHIQGTTDPVLALLCPLLVCPKASLCETMIIDITAARCVSFPFSCVEMLPYQVCGLLDPVAEQSPPILPEFIDHPGGDEFA